MDENVNHVFEGRPRVKSLAQAMERFDNLKLPDTQRRRWLRILTALMNAEPDEGLSADDLADLAGDEAVGEGPLEAGLRVVAWDQRGHGDSEHAALYSWAADVCDARVVLDSTSSAPVHAVGHSKGGSILMALIQALPHRFLRFVNIEGIPSPGPTPRGPGGSRRSRGCSR